MTSSKTPLNGVSTEHQQDSLDSNGQKNVIIAEKTAAAITAQEQSPLEAKNQPSVPNPLPSPPQQQPPSNSQSRRPKDYSRARCLMFFPTSGRMGFETVKMSDELPPIEIIREMLAYETRIRLSESIQELMDVYHTDEAALR